MDHTVRFLHKIERSPDVFEFTLQLEAPISFSPGQYSRFWFPDKHALGTRTFTLTSLPEETTVRFIVRFPHPMSDYKQALLQLSPNDELRMDEPHGDAILPKLQTIPLKFIAQGIGIASYIAILGDVRQKGITNPIAIYWAHRQEEHTLLGEGEALPASVMLSRAVKPQRLTIDSVLSSSSNADALYYISGSQTFVEDFGGGLEAQGIERERIIFDYYEGYVEL